MPLVGPLPEELNPQPFKILVLLTERPGTLVTRAALREAVWGDETVVDFEHGLNTCIRQIRHALGDDADVPRFIETVPRLGYRFTAAVTSIPEPGPRPERWRTAGVAATILVAVVGVLIARMVPLGFPRSEAVGPEARELYICGQVALADPTTGSAGNALELFEKALALDATYAAAHAGVAQVYLARPSSIQGVPPDVAVLRARLAIDRALALDESLPEAHLANAELHTRGGAGDIAQMYIGLGEFDRAFEWPSRAVDDGGVQTLKVAAVWDPIRSDPRFEELLRKSGLGG